MDQQAEKDKTETVTGLGRRTREEIAKWNQMTALRFLTGGDIRHPRRPFGGVNTEISNLAVWHCRMELLCLQSLCRDH